MAASPVLKEGFLLKRDGKLISDFIKFNFTKENRILKSVELSSYVYLNVDFI